MQVDKRLRIYKHPHVTELKYPVTLARLRIKTNVVAQARATAALHSDTQSTLGGRNALLDHRRFDSCDRLFGDRDPLRRRRLGCCRDFP